MHALIFLMGIALGAAIGWRFGMIRASTMVAEVSARMRREVRQWRDAAARATAEAERIAQEAETWAAGCKQGREDVISIVPLLMAAQRRLSDDLPAAADGYDHS
jgi:hypothetical protein